MSQMCERLTSRRWTVLRGANQQTQDPKPRRTPIVDIPAGMVVVLVGPILYFPRWQPDLQTIEGQLARK
jgi:hypothetical protein